MPTLRTLGCLLLASTALSAVPAFAQSTTQSVPRIQPPSGETAADAPDADEDVIDSATPGAPQDGGEDNVDISAPGSSDFGDEIVVQGRYIPQPVRDSGQVVNVLSTEEIARAGDGDIAGALGRVTGLSVTNNGFVFVRGLGDRYSLALLNGMALPSPEPLRRVVPLDLFPTSVVSSAVVQKSYSVNYPGEFGGGVINLTTPAIPDENYFTIGAGISGDSETTAQFGYTYYGSDLDVIGYDDGTRSRDLGSLRDALDTRTPITQQNYGEGDLSGLAKLVPVSATGVLQRNFEIPANASFDASGGFSFYAGDTRIGVIANAGLSNGWRTREATQQIADGPTFNRNTQVVRTENRIVANGLLGIGAEFDSYNKIRFTNLYIHDTSKLARRSGAYTFNTGDVLTRVGDPFDVIESQTSYIQRQLINSQVVGEFKVGDISIDARASYANSKRNSPLEWTIPYFFRASQSAYVNDLRAAPPSIGFSDLNEDVWNGGFDISYPLPTALNVVLSAGYNYTDTSRDFINRTLEFRDGGSQIANETILPFVQLPIQYLLSPGSIDYNDIYLNETTVDTLNIEYRGDLTVNGVYAKAEVEPAQGVRIEAGVRYEDGKQAITLVDYFGTNASGDFVRELNNDYFLPAATLTWNFADNYQFRLSGSKTIARPQFRELAPIPYQDVESDRRFSGNPFLIDSQLYNAEGRVEYYPGRGERVSIAGFYKKIDNPIETIADVNENRLSATFANAPSANLYGAEFELVKFFPLDSLGGDLFATKRLVLSANYTYSKSNIQANEDDTVLVYRPPNNSLALPSNQVFVNGRPITGQSEHLANVQFGFEDTDMLQQLTFLLTYASDRVSNRGPRNTGGGIDPDIVESPGLRLDIVARQGFDIWGQQFEMKFEARNITGRDFYERQFGDGYTVLNNVYELGTTFAASIAARF